MMKQSWRDSLRNYAGIQRASAFILTLVLVIMLLPKEQLFKYEYQVHQPWKHEKLLAPFDFGILKSSQEIENEQNLVRNNQPPVFKLEPSITDRIISNIDRTYASTAPDSIANCDSILFEGIELLSSMLHLGLIERSNEKASTIKPFDEIQLYRNGELSTMGNHEALSLQIIMDSLNSFKESSVDSLCGTAFFNAAKKHIEFNAPYDDSITNRLLDRALTDIVTIEGRINKGTTIIDRGDLVSDEKHKILESLRIEFEERTVSGTTFRWSIVGQIGIVVILLSLLILYIYMTQERVFNDPRPVTLTFMVIALLFAMSRLAMTSADISIYAIPVGIVALLLRMFYDFKVSIFSFIILTLLVALFTSNPLEYTIIQVSAISFATLYQASSTRRSKMLGTALLVFVGYSVIYVFLSIAQNGSWQALEGGIFGWFAINALLCTVVFPLIYVVEKVFGYVSETTLLELGDSNQPLLKELAVKAPGTFQHSLQVANLCEKVATQIGGNAVLLRTAAMYHDVGKMNEPQFFIENQIPDNNPHDDLEPQESASIIINHVIKGIELCRGQNLPFDIIEFVQTHHGTGTVRFFLKKAEAIAEEKGTEVEREKFSYPGPTPKTKEQAILMMCDSVEAASRTLKRYDKEAIGSLVEGLIDFQNSEGQFDDAPITYKDISQAKRTLKVALNGIYHQRVSYD